MTNLRLDWHAIRPLDGSRDKGFEELCAQLARAESPPGSCFERKGTPDAGVECYAILTDGSEWGWQSKYFDVLGDSQWSQIDKSVGKALEKHPRLKQYFVCVPLDLPDGRIEKRKSAKDRWNEHVQKWKERASHCGMNVEFTYWGSHHLLQRLAQPQHVGLVRFFFDVRGFDGAWFSARLDEALRTAGPRYTAEIRVDLPIAGEFEAFGRTERLFDGVKKHARTIRDKLRIATYSDVRAPGDQILDAATSSLVEKVEAVLEGFATIEVKPTGALPFAAISQQIIVAMAAVEEVTRLLLEREKAQDEEAATTAKKTSRLAYPSKPNPFHDRRIHIYALSAELRLAREALAHADRVAGSALMLLRGDAGTGKTHLLCDVARQRVEANQGWMPEPPELYRMFLGEHGWAPASRYFQQPYYGDAGWTELHPDCPIQVRNVASEYLREASGVDCSLDETYTLRLPVAELVSGMGLRWSGNGAEFLENGGQRAAFDPTAHADGPSALLLREEQTRKFLDRERLTLGWVVCGEKRVLSPRGRSGPHHPALRLSGAYVLGGKGLVGLLKCTVADPAAKSRRDVLLNILQTGNWDEV